jgi:hypothetical protein
VLLWVAGGKGSGGEQSKPTVSLTRVIGEAAVAQLVEYSVIDEVGSDGVGPPLPDVLPILIGHCACRAAGRAGFLEQPDHDAHDEPDPFLVAILCGALGAGRQDDRGKVDRVATHVANDDVVEPAEITVAYISEDVQGLKAVDVDSRPGAPGRSPRGCVESVEVRHRSARVAEGSAGSRRRVRDGILRGALH